MRRRIPIQDLLLLKMNPVTRFLILTDVFFYTATGFLGPIFALFITDFIQGGNAAVAGTAAAIFALTKSVMQLPAAAIIDKVCGDKDDFWFMALGMIAVNLIPLSYLFVETPAQLYMAQFALGLATAFTFPSFMALFTRYVEKGREGTVWGVYYTLTDFSSAGAAAIGGILATTIGFEKVILIVSLVGLTGTLLYIPVYRGLKRTPASC